MATRNERRTMKDNKTIVDEDSKRTMKIEEAMDSKNRRRTMKIDESKDGKIRRRTVKVEDAKDGKNRRRTVQIKEMTPHGILQEDEEIATALKELHGFGGHEELLYYDKKVRRQTAKLVELAAMSQKTMFRRQTKVVKKQKKCVLLPILNEEVESQNIAITPDQQYSNMKQPDTLLDKKLNPWSKEGLEALYEEGLHVGKGLSRPPHVIPYRFLGTPDLKRDDSLLPKTFQFAKRMKFPSLDDHRDGMQCMGGEPMVLPLTLKAACWNGERWEGTSQTTSEAKRNNGFDTLYTEVVKSQKRAILCKTGQYFLDGIFAPPKEEYKESTRRTSIVSELPQRQHKRRPSVAKPFIPPLPLQKLPQFEQIDELGHNQEILSAYREESTRYATARLALPTNRSTQDHEVLLSGRTISGLPLKACGDISLRQLGDILSTNTRFKSMQNYFNGKLMDSLRAIQTSRPYHYAREYGLKHKGAWDSNGTPRRASTFRSHLVKFKWYEDLLDMSYSNGRHPTKSEFVIIEDIRLVLDQGERYSLQRLTNLIMELGRRKMDTNSPHVQQAFSHVQNALNITDVELLSSLMKSRAKIPLWLESKTVIVNKALHNLSPQRFPMCNWVDAHKRPKTPIGKLRKLFWMNQKLSSLSHNSLLGTHKQSILIRDLRSRDFAKSKRTNHLLDHGSMHNRKRNTLKI